MKKSVFINNPEHHQQKPRTLVQIYGVLLDCIWPMLILAGQGRHHECESSSQYLTLLVLSKFDNGKLRHIVYLKSLDRSTVHCPDYLYVERQEYGTVYGSKVELE